MHISAANIDEARVFDAAAGTYTAASQSHPIRVFWIEPGDPEDRKPGWAWESADCGCYTGFATSFRAVLDAEESYGPLTYTGLL